MLTKSLVHEVKSLLNLGTISQREIAKRTGVSRGTVGALATGKRGLWGSHTQDVSEEVVERCPGCGGMVYMPCVLCTIRNAPRLTEASNVEVPSGEDLRTAYEATQCSSRTEALG